MQFKDHFSSVSAAYASYRPGYPPALFAWLAALPRERLLAWDCACGTGQATLLLSGRFERVVATDASGAQIRAAPRDLPNVDWRVAPAERSGLAEGSTDLITVAQALHWFDLPPFYAEVKRVLKPGGALAVWCYGIHQIEGDTVNEVVQDFYSNVIGPYWPPERKLIEEGYRSLPFPFREITVPEFHMECAWNLDQLLGYLRTWSATTRYIEVHRRDPVQLLEQKLSLEWGPVGYRRSIAWPLSLRAGVPSP